MRSEKRPLWARTQCILAPTHVIDVQDPQGRRRGSGTARQERTHLDADAGEILSLRSRTADGRKKLAKQTTVNAITAKSVSKGDDISDCKKY